MNPTPNGSCTSRIIYLDHRPFAICVDWQEAEKLAFDLRIHHHPRRVSVLYN